ncbi:MAG: hypothetical protein IPH84_18760 [Bacteroidales bacterium]|nr:hypothetical protein [Bacteroidales bacterium]
MKKGKKRLIVIISSIVLLAIAIPVVFLINATINQFKPKDIVTLGAFGSTAMDSIGNEPLTVFTWNIGHAGLGKEMDFFNEGGKQVRPSKEQYQSYINSILNTVASLSQPSFIMLQEIDRNSKRSYNDNQFKGLMEKMSGYSYFFAPNYKAGFVPVPISEPMGKVDAGIVTLSQYKVSEALRYAYPSPDEWPSELFRPKQCFLLTRIPTKSGKDLVLINTHNSPDSDAAEVRKQELSLLKKTMEREFNAGNYVIVGGGWNQSPATYDPTFIKDGNVATGIHPGMPRDFLPQGWQWAYDSIRSTSREVAAPYIPGKTPTTVFDFFVISPNVELKSVRTAETGFNNSNHQPVRLEFRLNL